MKSGELTGSGRRHQLDGISPLPGKRRVLHKPCSGVLSLMWVCCRINYQIATPGIAAKARSVAIYKDERFSDHAPLTVDYDFTLRG